MTKNIHLLLTLFSFVLSTNMLLGQLSASLSGIDPSNPSEKLSVSFYGPTINLEEGRSISFSWNINGLIDSDFIYEFELYKVDGHATKPIFSTNTDENYVVVTEPDTELEYGANYSARINVKLISNNVSERLTNVAPAIDFVFLPECTPPKNLRISDKGEDFVIIEWDGDSENSEGVTYEVKQKFSKAIGEKNSINRITSSNSIRIDGMIPTMPYDFSIRKVCDDSKNDFTPYSKWVKISNVILAGQHPVSLPPFNCGDNFDNVCDSQNTTNGPVYVGDTIYIYGFPILVDSIGPSYPPPKSLTDSIFWGFGYMPLPFNDKVIYVAFGNVKQIDGQGRVCNTDAYASGVCCFPGLGKSVDCGDYDFPPAQFGGEICIPIPDTSLIDDYGFDTSGQYVRMPPYPGWSQGDPFDPNYDPNGFGPDGIHFQTQDTLGPGGCSRNGYDLNGYPCDPSYCPDPELTPPCPYYWLDTLNQGPPTQAGQEFEEIVNGLLDSLIEVYLNELASDFQDSLTSQESICNGIRSIMNSKVAVLNFNTDYIYGENNQYFNKGLHDYFTSEPQYLAEHRAERDTNVVVLEKKHVELYHCDIASSKFEDFLNTVTNSNNSTSIGEIASYISDLIVRLTQEEIDDLQDPGLFENWLRERVFEYLENEVEAGGGNIVDEPDKNIIPGGYETGDKFIEESIKDLENLLVSEKNNKFNVKLLPFVEGQLDCSDSTRLPIKLTKQIGSKEYTIYIDNIYVDNVSGGSLDAYFPLELTGSDQTILFSANSVDFGPTGLENGNARLALDNDVAFRLSNAAKVVIKGGVDSTFVEWNCYGVDTIGIDAELKICREYLIPVEPNTITPIEDENVLVTGRFTARMQKWGDFYVGVDFDPFVVKGAENVGWTIDEAYFDFSDISSPPNIQAPPGYTHQMYGPNGFDGPWKGVYMKELSVIVSSDFTGDTTMTTFGVQNMIFDNTGFSGNVFMSPLLSLDKGNLNGWAFSIDTLQVNILHNQLKGGGFNGYIQVPLFSADKNPTSLPREEECFEYTALFQPNNRYYFSVSPPATSVQAPLFSAGSITLDSNSLVEILYDNGFTVDCFLHGSIQIGVSEGGESKFNIPQVNFQDLHIQNKDPYILSTGTWLLPDSLGTKVAGFELVLNNFNMPQYEGEDPQLQIGAKVLLGNSDDKLYIDASGSFRIVGEFTEVQGRQRWVYKNFKIDSFNLVGSFPGVPYIQGYIKFYEDNPTYGDGFQGGVGIQISALNDVSLRAVAQFGKVNNYKYFFVDALACNLGIKMGALTLQGVGGGVSYRMNRDTIFSGGLLCEELEIPTTIGLSLSGAQYSPDADIGLGLKLTVALSTTDETAFNGNATFEILFNNPDSSGGGIRNIAIYGNCKFMNDFKMDAPPTYSSNVGDKPDNGAAINAYFKLEIDFGNPGTEEGTVFHGDFKVNIELYDDFITGGGDIAVHVEKDYWYFKAGTPDLPIFVTFNVLDNSIAEVGMYLQLGNQIDPMPDLPEKIYALTGATRTNSPSEEREWSPEARRGVGFGFGSYLKLGDQDEKQFLIFYSTLYFELGFDMLVKKYSNDILCKETENTPGINGWFSMGQAYAYLEASVGIKAKLFGVTKKYEIVDVTGGMALQAQLPNPFWAEGAFGIKYNILGLIKGSGNFKFQVGEKCTRYIPGGAENLSVIREFNPGPHQDTPFPVNWHPSVDFNFPMNQRLSLQIDEDESINYDLKLVSAEILSEDDNVFTASGELNIKKDKFTFKPDNFLPGNETFKIHIIAQIDSLGQTIGTEDTTVVFTTGDPLDYIPEFNVIGSYPLNGQYNFYKGEIQDAIGYVQLEYGQPDLFFQSGNYFGRYTDTNGNIKEVELTYLTFDSRVEFDIPTEFFSNNSLYKFEIIFIPSPNVADGRRKTEEKVLYSLFFRVSQYDVIKAKIFDINNSIQNNSESYTSPVWTVGVPYWSISEPFDKFEILGNGNKFGPLMAFEMDDDNFEGEENGNKPSKGRDIFGKSGTGTTIPGVTFYQKFPFSGTCEIYQGYNIEIGLDRESPPSNEIKLRHGPNTWSQAWRGDLDNLIITEEIFESNTIPTSNFNQYLFNNSFGLFANDYLHVRSQVISIYQEIISAFEAANYSYEVAEGFASDCLSENNIFISDFLPGRTFFGDGLTAYKIYTAYRLPGHEVVNYSNNIIHVPDE